ncbi:GGDEF domain-containing protein [Candidatus Bipolaricaulota bacterium]|nr:GGDEF domain-containing protein [Candidatus Bipolaricaulota bacterium]
MLEENSYIEVNLQLSDNFFAGSGYFFNCYVFSAGGYYYLIGEKRRSGDGEVLEKIFLLNNALANKTRKLTKKNKELERANEKIEELSRIDVLTGLANRRHFMDYFEKMISQARRHSNPLSLAILDLDKFKEVNDTYGHHAGDEVLSAVGDLLNEETRGEDMAARVGGEEFAILLTRTGGEEAFSQAERIRNRITELGLESVSRDVSASIGISTMTSGDDPEHIM